MILEELNRIELPLEKEQRENILAMLIDWLGQTPKVTHPQLEQKLSAFKRSLRNFVDGIELSFVGGQPTVTCKGMVDQILVEMKHGSLWFLGEPNIEKLIFAAALE